MISWGNGSYKSSYKRHRSAPNKGFQKKISNFFPLVLVDESNTSKISCCCNSEDVNFLNQINEKRSLSIRCNDCKKEYHRDTNAAINIYHRIIQQLSSTINSND